VQKKQKEHLKNAGTNLPVKKNLRRKKFAKCAARSLKPTFQTKQPAVRLVKKNIELNIKNFGAKFIATTK